MRDPKTPKFSDFDQHTLDPSRVAEAIARGEFGRFYWNEKLETQLRQQNARAGERIAEIRQGWKSTARSRAKTMAKDFRRRIRLAQEARDKQADGQADGE